MRGVINWMMWLIPMLGISIVLWLAEVATARYGQLETVYVETFFIGVGKQPHKIVLLQA